MVSFAYCLDYIKHPNQSGLNRTDNYPVAFLLKNDKINEILKLRKFVLF